jgi:hypothetical protein
VREARKRLKKHRLDDQYSKALKKQAFCNPFGLKRMKSYNKLKKSFDIDRAYAAVYSFYHNYQLLKSEDVDYI